MHKNLFGDESSTKDFTETSRGIYFNIKWMSKYVNYKFWRVYYGRGLRGLQWTDLVAPPARETGEASELHRAIPRGQRHRSPTAEGRRRRGRRSGGHRATTWGRWRREKGRTRRGWAHCERWGERRRAGWPRAGTRQGARRRGGSCR